MSVFIQDVIDLTTDLIHAAPGSSNEAESETVPEDIVRWSIGDACEAIYSEDGL